MLDIGMISFPISTKLRQSCQTFPHIPFAAPQSSATIRTLLVINQYLWDEETIALKKKRRNRKRRKNSYANPPRTNIAVGRIFIH